MRKLKAAGCGCSTGVRAAGAASWGISWPGKIAWRKCFRSNPSSAEPFRCARLRQSNGASISIALVRHAADPHRSAPS
jgi:hypothetical protein